jgi:5-methylthioadenosine/S-adenosylhomocysteine deaminase
MQPADLIIHARWLLTCEPEYKVLENHALVIKDGLILNVLPSQKATEKYASTIATEHFSRHMLMPGFVNSHTHLAMNLFRGLADDMALMEWLNTHIWPAEGAWVSHQFVYDASLLAMAEMIRSGTTCFNDMYFFLQASADAAEVAGLRANIGITVIGIPTAWAKTPAEYISKGLEFYSQFKNHPLIKTTFAPHAIYTVTDAELTQIRDLAQENDLKINMHVQETMDEVNQSLKETNLRPLRRLHNLGLVTPRLIAVHMTQIVDDDLEILAAHKPSIVHCPESNMKLASGICPIQEFKKMGLNVALGTDGAASNNDLNMIAEMRSAAFLSKVSTGDSSITHSYEVMKMATINGAKALGIDDITGTLTAGKAADFIAIDLDRIETLPVYHPTSSLVYASAREQVTDVWVAGKQLMKNRVLLTIDEAAVKAKAAEWQHKIKANASQVPLKP